MTEPRKSIFRASAWDRYVQAHEAAVLPRFVTPRSLTLLWLLVVALLLTCGIVWSIHLAGAPSVSALLPWHDDLLPPGP
jgi:hypothetical protein